VERQWAQLKPPIPIMSTATLASCAEAGHKGVAKISVANKTRFIICQTCCEIAGVRIHIANLTQVRDGTYQARDDAKGRSGQNVPDGYLALRIGTPNFELSLSLIRDNRVAAEIGEIAFQARDILTIGLANGTKFRHRSHRPQRSRRPDAKLTIGIADALASGIEHRDKSA
jgi:hypothetical protein